MCVCVCEEMVALTRTLIHFVSLWLTLTHVDSCYDLQHLREQFDAQQGDNLSLLGDAGKELLSRYDDLRASLKAFPFGDPGEITAITRHKCDDSLVQAHGAATRAVIETELARSLWELRCVDAMLAKGETHEKNDLATSLVNIAMLRLRLFQTDGAHIDLQRAISLGTDDARAGILIRYCAQLQASRAEDFLEESTLKSSRTEQLLQTVRAVFLAAGYRVTTVLNATRANSMSEFIFVDSRADKLEKSLFEAAREANPMTPENEKDKLGLPPNLVDLIRIFLLHRVVPLSRLNSLFGAEVLGTPFLL